MGEFVRGLREGYEKYRGLSEEVFEEAVFVTRPGSGAFGELFDFLSAGGC